MQNLSWKQILTLITIVGYSGYALCASASFAPINVDGGAQVSLPSVSVKPMTKKSVDGGVVVKLQTAFDFKVMGYNNNDNEKKNKLFSGFQPYYGFSSSVHANLDIRNTSGEAFEYGCKLDLETTSLNDRTFSSGLYLIGNSGKLELGSEKSATSKMRITAYSIASGTVGSWEPLFRNKYATTVAFMTGFGNFIDGKMRVGTQSEYSRKITYFTPKVYGCQLGISYVPDTSNLGSNASIRESSYASFKDTSNYEFSVKNAIGYGITNEFETSSGMRVKTAIVGENGQIIPFKAAIRKHGKIITPAERIDLKLHNLATYTIGSELRYKEWSFAASYIDFLKSFVLRELDQKNVNTKRRAWAVGMRYEYDKFSASLNYLNGFNAGSRTHITTLAADYKPFRGIMPYGECTFYDATALVKDGKSDHKKLRGYIFLIGVRVGI
ncbi:putative porin [Rickettsiales endosymbiont of Paramecium tredecaurelia]|uniref:porin n=1 Tax=Candidatus Sarmatiella mevalonica TaxID=2770581 RepID=UPI001924C4E8|nr:porin [Candidatus Sarmatiella mevalonica]MBL3285090.1 putative porin [Candidatus Sarmatiella mevalonica]